MIIRIICLGLVFIIYKPHEVISHPGHKKDNSIKTKDIDGLISVLLHSEKFQELAQKIADTAVEKMMNSSINETNDKHEKKSKKKHSSDKGTPKSTGHQNIDETKNANGDTVSLKFEKFREEHRAAKHKKNKKSKRTSTSDIASSKQSHESKESEENIKGLKSESKSESEENIKALKSESKSESEENIKHLKNESNPTGKNSTPNKDQLKISHESKETKENIKSLRSDSKLDILQPIKDEKTTDKSIESVNSDSVDLSEESPLNLENHTENNDTSISEEKNTTDNSVDGLSQPVETPKSKEDDKDRSSEVLVHESSEEKNPKRKDMRIFREEGSKVYAIELTPDYDEYHEKLMRANAS